MAVCLDYQAVYSRKPMVLSVKLQVAVTFVLLMVLIFKVWVKVSITDLGYRLAAEQQKTIDYGLMRRELEFKLSVIKRPDNIAKSAQKRLGLRPLQSDRVWRIPIHPY